VDARLFVALWPDAGAIGRLSPEIERVRGQAGDAVRWQPPERWHITMAFLGQADPARSAQRIAHAARGDGLGPVGDLRLSGSGTFGPIIWIGVEHGPQLADLAVGLQRILRGEDRRFRAHVTVGRVRGAQAPRIARGAAQLLAEHRGPGWTPRELTLVESTTGPHPAYRVLERWPLPSAPGSDAR
jgi:2'-5' RNA ligase